MTGLFVISLIALCLGILLPIIVPIAFGTFLAIKRRTPRRIEAAFFIAVETVAVIVMLWGVRFIQRMDWP